MLMDRYAGPIIHLAFRFLGTQQDAEEVAQDVFLRLHLRPPALAPGAKLFTWLYRVMINRCYDLLRQRSRRPQQISIDLPDEGADSGAVPLAEQLASSARTPRERVAESEIAAITRRAVAALPFQLRAPLLLSVFEQFSHQEIGAILRVSPKAVERRIHRARELLKARLAPHLR